MRKFILFISISTVIFSGSFAFAATDATKAKPTEVKQYSQQEIYDKLAVMGDVFETVNTAYVEDVDQIKLIENAINGALTSLDPHSSFMNKTEYSDMRDQTSGSFGGLGIEVMMDKDVIKVVSPIDDTPAFEAGIKAGDYIIKINDEAVEGLTIKQAVEKMRGKPGTKVHLKVFREEPKRDVLDFDIPRAIIKVTPVKSEMLVDGIGYMRVSTFNSNVEVEAKKALINLKKANKGAPLLGLIIDLRNNPGGLLDQAIKLSDMFLDGGEIVSTKGKTPESKKQWSATSGDLLNNSPIVVLVSGGSASASEIVAGALQDHRRAVILGTKTFGKASVQTIIPLRGGVAMRLTTARYYTPSGRSIQASGIVPDIEIKQSVIEKTQDETILTKESELLGHLNAEKAKIKESQDKKDSKKDVKRITSKDDYQLNRAIDTIKAVSIWNRK